VAVKPIGPALLNREAIGEGRAGVDPTKADSGDAIHFWWDQQAVPMNGCDFPQAVRDTKGRLLTFFEANEGSG
jgi:hypothetical protein